MNAEITQLVSHFESGRITRRELISRLSVLTAVAAGFGGNVGAQETSNPTFKATGLNHIALRVTDVARSRDFYLTHLGMSVARENLPGDCFLTFPQGFLALFRGDTSSMDHYCYSVEKYAVDDAVEKLEAAGLTPRRGGTNRVYFPDPDGLTVQLAAPDHGP